jgi:hypothetical protein
LLLVGQRVPDQVEAMGSWGLWRPSSACPETVRLRKSEPPDWFVMSRSAIAPPTLQLAWTLPMA